MFWAALKEVIAFKFSLLQNFVQKWKILNLGTKIPNLGIFQLEFEDNIVIFETNAFKFVKFYNFVKEWKSINLEPKCFICLFLV